MNYNLYGAHGVQFLSGGDISRKSRIKNSITDMVETTLLDINQMWRVIEIETPILEPIVDGSNQGAFTLDHSIGVYDQWSLRQSTYYGTSLIAHKILSDGHTRIPLCVHQHGRVFRKEEPSGANSAKQRYHEFDQLDFLCVFGANTTSPIAQRLRVNIMTILSKLTDMPTQLIAVEDAGDGVLERIDVQVMTGDDWCNVASTRIRNDFPDIIGSPMELTVLEVSIGLDRLVGLSTDTY